MPELCRFDGIIIYMYFEDLEGHNKPHIHVWFGEYNASIAIDGQILAGKMPVKQLKKVSLWLSIHEEDLYKAWNLAVRNQHFDKIPPLE